MSVHGFNYRLDPCSHCNATFKSKVSLDDHILKKHPEFVTSITRKIYKCSKCVYQTTVKNHFNDHMSVHPETATGHTSMHQGTTPSYSVTCAHCNVKLKSKRALDDHVIRKHPDFVTSVSRKIHECSMCSYKTLHKSSFDKHMTTHTETTSTFKLRECIHCNATFKSRASLDDHTLRKHPDFIATITRKIYECINCIYKTTIKSHFNKHMSVHTENARDPEAVSCIHCNLILKTKAALDEHVVKKHPDSIASLARRIYECLQCFYKTTIKRNFDRHLSTHSEDVSSCELIQCDHCTAKFKSKLSLDDHVVRKHPSFIESVTSKIYECEHCVFKTIKKHDFDKHLSTHFEISPSSSSVTCIHCNDTFKSDRWRDAHIMKRHPEFTSSLTRKVYECTICPYKTILKFKFDRHMLEHPETASSYKFSSCHHCGAKFKIKADLDEHLVENHPNFIVSLSRKVYECTYCVYKTTVKKSLDKHMSSHPEADPSDKPNTCMYCNVTLCNKRVRDDHVVKKHPHLAASVNRKIFECAECSYRTILRSSFSCHMQTHSKSSTNNKSAVTSKLYECSQCIYKTVIERSFDQHMSMHSATASTHKPNPCIHCNATFKNKGSLNDHILKKHPDFVSSITKKINTCTTCNFKTTIKHQFDRHMSVHSGISPISKTFTCIHCDAIVKSRNALTDHVVRKHPNFITSVTNKIYECTQCVYKTVKKYDLDKHLSTHSKTASRSNFSTRKIYECTLCPYKTVFKYKLDRHMLKHAETDKINACIHCNATFKNKADLDEHVVRRHPNFTSSLSRKIYECTQCVYKSLRKKSFVKHMSRHPEAVPGDSLNRCVHCNATLRSKRALDDHVVRKHPDSAAPVGRKILECTECRFKTVLKGSLAQHMLTHFKAYNL
nr:unnamed protein product [Callosobruchus chinensis]